MEHNFPNNNTKAGTLGGTLLVIVLSIRAEELLKTACLACVGAVVSFFVSAGLKFLLKKLKS